MENKTVGIDYEIEYMKLSIENDKLTQENSDLKKAILSMIKVYSTVDDMNKVFKDIERELKIISKRK